MKETTFGDTGFFTDIVEAGRLKALGEHQGLRRVENFIFRLHHRYQPVGIIIFSPSLLSRLFCKEKRLFVLEAEELIEIFKLPESYASKNNNGDGKHLNEELKRKVTIQGRVNIAEDG